MTTQQEALDLEKYIVPFSRGLKEAPEGAQEAVEKAGGGRPGTIPVAFAFTEKTGWVVLISAGQGPFVAWREIDDDTKCDANGSRIQEAEREELG